MVERFLSQTSFVSQEDYRKNLHIRVPENFNFGYDVVDAYAAEQPGKEALLRAARACLHAALPPRAAGSVLEICRLANKIFSGYIGGQLVDALLVGGETFALMSIFGLEYAPLLAVLAALLKQAVGAGLTARGLDENGEPRRNLPGGPQEN